MVNSNGGVPPVAVEASISVAETFASETDTLISIDKYQHGYVRDKHTCLVIET